MKEFLTILLIFISIAMFGQGKESLTYDYNTVISGKINDKTFKKEHEILSITYSLNDDNKIIICGERTKKTLTVITDIKTSYNNKQEREYSFTCVTKKGKKLDIVLYDNGRIILYYGTSYVMYYWEDTNGKKAQK